VSNVPPAAPERRRGRGGPEGRRWRFYHHAGGWQLAECIDLCYPMKMQTREIKEYKKFVIEADPQKSDDGTWRTYIVISRDRPGGPRLRPFEDGEKFAKRLDAIRHCFDFGTRIIDGQVPNMTIEDL